MRSKVSVYGMQDQISIMSVQNVICSLPGEILREVKVHT